ncbi:hypothetical protein ACFO3O_11560 [Dokdonia ponticola]|uniref:Uncharacterized protein n=1 Tax=Dokdonia ponticola TaxID=2041041 RepID=A0ABV9HZ96_9FLAO
MKFNLDVLLLLIINLFLVNCANKSSPECLSKLDISNKTTLIIPVKGCQYCISESLWFAEKNLENKKITIIITGYISDRDLRLSISEKLYNSSKVRKVNDISYFNCQDLVEGKPIYKLKSNKEEIFTIDAYTIENSLKLISEEILK